MKPWTKRRILEYAQKVGADIDGDTIWLPENHGIYYVNEFKNIVYLIGFHSVRTRRINESHFKRTYAWRYKKKRLVANKTDKRKFKKFKRVQKYTRRVRVYEW